MIAPAIIHAARTVPTIVDATSFERWRLDRVIEAHLILAEAPRHPSTLVALAARVLADAQQMGGAA